MATLTRASHEWATRPDDERFTSLDELLASARKRRNESRGLVVSNRAIDIVPGLGNALKIRGPGGNEFAPSNWAFGQLATLAGAPAGYLKTLPAPIVADNLNYGLKFNREVEDIGLLLQKNPEVSKINAATGPRYGRIWNDDILTSVVDRFGNGRDGDWKIPGEFGKAVEVTKANTTLYASDRDMFIFLADEQNRIEIPNRRNGEPGSLARGFFLWNSEVGSATFGLGTFRFDYVCCNRMVWGSKQYAEITIRHTAKANDRWLEEMEPALLAYSQSSGNHVVDMVKAAQARKIEKVEEFLANRFGKRLVGPLMFTHNSEENRPIETLWDVTTAATAYARGIQHQDTRVEMERVAGEVLELAAA